MRSTSAVLAFGAVFALTSAAGAETIRGRVVDKKTGAAVEGAVVSVSRADGFQLTASTGADGRYAVDVEPGKYQVVFVQDEHAMRGTLIVTAGSDTTFDVKLRIKTDEVIVLEDLKTPAVMPVPKNPSSAVSAPPYSDAAIDQDAWTRAWLLLDLDETGTVTQLKFLKKPGYDLEPIAIAEGFKLRFEPARNERGQAVRTFLLWPIEWVAQSYSAYYGSGLTTRMPETWGLGRGSRAQRIPCKGSGPWLYTNRIVAYHGYRDCSRPDLSKVNREPWILPSR